LKLETNEKDLEHYTAVNNSIRKTQTEKERLEKVLTFEEQRVGD